MLFFSIPLKGDLIELTVLVIFVELKWYLALFCDDESST